MFLGEIIAQKCKEKELLGGSGLNIFFCINVGKQNEKKPCTIWGIYTSGLFAV